jgi:hypothetical protein
MDEEKLKDELVAQVQKMAALLTVYTQMLGVDAYECNLEFMASNGEARIRMTDARYKADPKSGKLTRLSSGDGPDASTLDEAEARRQKAGGHNQDDDKPTAAEPQQTPEQVVAALMKRLRLK